MWLGSKEGLWRIDENESEPLSRIQCFRATTYMLDNNVQVIDGDGDNGVWVLTETSISHIQMKSMSVRQKADFLSQVNWNVVQRRGMLSGARWDKKKEKWVGKESDNDGLWTSLVAIRVDHHILP